MQICQAQFIITYCHGCAHYDEFWNTTQFLFEPCMLFRSYAQHSSCFFTHCTSTSFVQAYSCSAILCCIRTDAATSTNENFMVMAVSPLKEDSNNFQRNPKCVCSWWLSRNVSCVDRHNCIGQIRFVGTGWDLSWAHGQDLPTHFYW